jgi:hypothetical protein
MTFFKKTLQVLAGSMILAVIPAGCAKDSRVGHMLEELLGPPMVSIPPGPDGPPAVQRVNYFPLHQGNRWTYTMGSPARMNNDTMTITVTGTQLLDGESYFILEYKYQTAAAAFDSMLVRQDPTGRIWLWENGQAWLWLDVTLAGGGRYAYPPSQGYEVSVRNIDSVQTPLREFNGCLWFDFDQPMVADACYGYILAKEIGIVKMPGCWITWVLVSYIISIDRVFIIN